jgi:hypothetical protein
VAQVVAKEEPQWANPGALGLAAFGLNTILLQIHNLGWMESTLPLTFGFFWGGIAQVIAGIIDARRGDTFGLTAFTSYGVFWLGLSFSFLLQWMGLVTLDDSGIGWLFVMWAIFTGFMTIGTFKMTVMHVYVFVTLTILFLLLAAHFFGWVSAVVPGVEGIFCGLGAVWGSAAVVVNNKYGRTVIPLGTLAKK